MNRILIVILASQWAIKLIAGGVVLAQDEIDHVVDAEVLRSMHPDDAQASIDFLKGRGATTSAIADSIGRSLRRNLNVPKDDEGNHMANAAIHWLEVLGDQNQISNLLYVAQVATNVHAAAAARAYYRKISDKKQFIDIANGLLLRAGMNDLKSTVWICLEKEATGAHRAKVLEIANGKLQSGFVNLYYADGILARWQKGYAESVKRKTVLKDALGDPSTRAAFPAAHRVLLKRSNGVIER